LLNILFAFYFTEFCAVLIALPSLSQTLPTKVKNRAPLPNTEREVAGLILRLTKYIRVVRLFAPGAHCLKYCGYVSDRSFVAYCLVLFIAYRTIFIVVYRLVRAAA